MITIVPYNEAWPSAFQSEAELIRSALGPLARRVEHVGSTSIPGISAKPVIDIQVSVPTLEPLSTYVQSLFTLCYTHFALGDFDLTYPFFQKPGTWPSTHHVHLCVEGSDLERKHFKRYRGTSPQRDHFLPVICNQLFHSGVVRIIQSEAPRRPCEALNRVADHARG